MNANEEAVLAYLKKQRSPKTAKEVAIGVWSEAEQRRVRNAVRRLVRVGLVSQPDTGLYESVSGAVAPDMPTRNDRPKKPKPKKPKLRKPKLGKTAKAEAKPAAKEAEPVKAKVEIVEVAEDTTPVKIRSAPPEEFLDGTLMTEVDVTARAKEWLGSTSQDALVVAALTIYGASDTAVAKAVPCARGYAQRRINKIGRGAVKEAFEAGVTAQQAQEWLLKLG